MMRPAVLLVKRPKPESESIPHQTHKTAKAIAKKAKAVHRAGSQISRILDTRPGAPCQAESLGDFAREF